MKRVVIVTVAIALFGLGWAFAGPDEFRDSRATRPEIRIRQSDGEVVRRNHEGGKEVWPEHAEPHIVITAGELLVSSTIHGETEQIRHMDPDWQNNSGWFLLSPDEFAATRFAPSQSTRPFCIRSVAFVPEEATGSDAVLFFVAVDQAGYPGDYLFEGSIPSAIVNQYSGGFLHITFSEDTYLVGDFHFGVGTASAVEDSLCLYSDNGGGDATHSLLYSDGTWHTMPDIGHMNSWIMQGLIEYQAGADGKPQKELVDLVVSPNPFRTAAALRYDLNDGASVEVAILDIAGRRVKDLFNGPETAGSHTLCWDGTTPLGMRAPPGLYLCMLRAGGRMHVYEIVLVP